MVMHASFLRSMQAGIHLRGAPLPPPPPRNDPFATLDEKTRIFIIKDIFLHKYLSTSRTHEPSTFEDIVLKDHDGLFDWMKQRLDALDYATKPKGISYWEYDACYDEIKEIFFFSPIMASTAVKVFIEFHTRRMSATHLSRKDLPFFFTEKFPINKLQHLSLHIAAGDGKDDDHPHFHALIKAIPELHLTFTGLHSLKVEITWKPKSPNDTSYLQAPPHVARTRANIQKLAVMLCLETKRFGHVALMSGEKMIFSGDWHVDQQAVARLLAPGFAVPARVPSDSLPVAGASGVDLRFQWARGKASQGPLMEHRHASME